MSRKSKTSPAVLSFLREALHQAELNEMTEVFLWFKMGDESTDYEYLVDEADDLLYELGTVIMNERCAMAKGPEPMAN